MPKACGGLGFFRFKGCLLFFYMEETLEFLGIWLVLVAMLGHFSDAVRTPSKRVRRFLYALPAMWICFLVLASMAPRLELRFLAQPASVRFESNVQLHGYRIDDALVQLFASSKLEDYIGLGYSIHLVDQVSGTSVASVNQLASSQQTIWFFGPDYRPISREWLDVEVQPQSPANRALWMVLTLWRKKKDKYVRQVILESDPPFAE